MLSSLPTSMSTTFQSWRRRPPRWRSFRRSVAPAAAARSAASGPHPSPVRPKVRADSVQLNGIADGERTVQHGAEGGAIASFTYVYADPALTAELASCGITPGFANQDRCANHPEEDSDYHYGF